jgi:hypothetical protein
LTQSETRPRGAEKGAYGFFTQKELTMARRRGHWGADSDRLAASGSRTTVAEICRTWGSVRKRFVPGSGYAGPWWYRVSTPARAVPGQMPQQRLQKGLERGRVNVCTGGGRTCRSDRGRHDCPFSQSTGDENADSSSCLALLFFAVPSWAMHHDDRQSRKQYRRRSIRLPRRYHLSACGRRPGRRHRGPVRHAQ